jgi:hypothetical protein
MKKLFLAIVLVTSSLSFAQDRKEQGKREQFTPEQQTELHVKRMTLDLDLDDKQQKEIKALLLEQAKKREAKKAEMMAKREKGEKPTSDEKFAMKSEMLDNQIEMKAKMKKILKPEQFEKWEEMREERMEHRKDKAKKGPKGQKEQKRQREPRGN